MPRMPDLALVFVSATLSIGGVAYGVCISGDPADGGRGGAVAVAVSFAVLFFSRSNGAELYKILVDEVPKVRAILDAIAGKTAGTPLEPMAAFSDRLDQLTKRLNALTKRLEIDSGAQFKQNLFLTISSVIGTLTWGFGDLAVKALAK